MQTFTYFFQKLGKQVRPYKTPHPLISIGVKRSSEGLKRSMGKVLIIFTKWKSRRAVGGRCKLTKRGLGLSAGSFAIAGHYSTLHGLKLIELPVKISKIGKIFSNKSVQHLPLSKGKKGTLTWLKVSGEGTHATSAPKSDSPVLWYW